MRSSFYARIDVASLAVVDLTDYFGKGLIITRVNVPEAHRGKGWGRKMMTEVLQEADKTSTTLWLEISSSGEMTWEDLRSWYEKLGFTDVGGIFRRKPVV